MVVEVWKSHSQSSASHRTSTASAIIQSEFEGLRIKGPMVQVSESKGSRTRRSDVQGQEKMDLLAQEERERIHLPFAFLFHLGPQWIG